jgi:hypothetical protein
MLTNLRIRNFKSWKDTGPIRLAPITVFFGANSAGKTSLLQFLLMLKQTSESSDRGRVIHFGDDHSLVELGTFQDLIFEHDVENHLVFDLSWTLREPLKFNNRLKRLSYQAEAITFGASIASKGDKQYVESLKYEVYHEGTVPVTVHLNSGAVNKLNEYKISAEGYELIRKPGRAWPLPPPVRFYGFPDEVAAFYQNAGFTSDLALALEHQLSTETHFLFGSPSRPAKAQLYVGRGRSRTRGQ